MGISYRGGKVAGTAGQGGGSIAINSGLTGGSGTAALAGDLVVVTVSVGTAGRQPTIAIATPTGYTPLTAQRTTSSAIDTNVQTCYKVMGGTPDTAVTIPASGNNADGIAYTIQVFDGVDPVTPMDVAATFATNQGTDNLPDPASILPVTAGAWIVVCGGGAAGAGGTYTAAYLTNFLTANGADTNDANVGSGYLTWPGGTYDPAKFGGGSANAANSWGASTLALRPMAHPSTGALVGAGAAVDGAAAHIAIHATAGELEGAGSAIAGTAQHIAIHATSGALAGSGAALSGAAARTRAHATSGALVAPGSIIDGAAVYNAVHGAAGDLAGPGATVDGAAARTRAHAASGEVTGPGAALAGAASRTGAEGVTHETSGALVGQGSALAGSALHGSLVGVGMIWPIHRMVPRAGVVHDAAGDLVAQGALLRARARCTPNTDAEFMMLTF